MVIDFLLKRSTITFYNFLLLVWLVLTTFISFYLPVLVKVAVTRMQRERTTVVNFIFSQAVSCFFVMYLFVASLELRFQPNSSSTYIVYVS